MCREANLASSSLWMYIAYNIYYLYLLSIGIKMLLWHIFNWYHVFKVTPYWLCFRQIGGDWQKGGERFLPLIDILFIVLIFTPLLMIDKKGEKDFEFYICIFMFLHILSLIGILVSRTCLFVLKISLISRAFYYLCISMHV